MSEELSVEQRVHLLASADDERMAYFVKQVKTFEQVWSLSNEEGFVMVETDEGDCVMVWPDADFAAQWAVDDWDDCEPVSVPLTEFKTNWLPSLEADNIDIAVFPNIEDEGKLIKANELAEALTA
ncbi:DUF2750 domain-containing protein [Marinomonas sp. PE14-40]|uniref:DUF2750 domain-containing protein n=1 Tax=Marinomonas sp. PE14-40 TaxID=3060621 RepID=UPI003F6614C6